MSNTTENNRVTVSGEISSNFKFSHEVYGEKFYITDLKVQRSSGTYDVIPIMVSDRIIDVSEDYIGFYVSIVGQFRSFNNQNGDGKKQLILFIFVMEWKFIDEAERCEMTNHIELDGFICKEPVYRKTPLGREIADILLAVNRLYGKSDYIPCISWGRNARYVNSLKVGDRIGICGRIQSREYVKHISDTEQETRTAYEVSIFKLNEVINDEK